MKTTAAILIEQNQPLELWELDLPALKAGQVLVKMAYTGLCHTQLNEILGKKGPDPYVPHTLGHEGSGEIVELGAGVSKVKVGDKVVVSWLKGAGQDVPGSVYTYQGKNVNSGAVSTFMTYAVVSENRVVPLTQNIDLKIASLLGCAIPTGAGIIFNTLQARPGSSFAIFGVGGIGLAALLAALSLSPRQLIAIDVNAEKLQLAKDLGATHTINSAQDDVKVLLAQYTEKRGVDYAIEAVGLTSVMELAFSSVREGCGVCVLAGNPKAGEMIKLNPFDLIKGKKIIGTWGGETKLDVDVPHYVDLIIQGKMPAAKMISHEMNLSEINTGFKLLEAGKVTRCLIKL